MRVAALLLVSVLALAAAQEETAYEEPPPEETDAKDKEEGLIFKDKERKKKAEKYDYCKEKNCYDLLGVSKTSALPAIKKNCRRLKTEYHPDKCKSGDFEMCKTEYVKYANACDILQSTEMRANYDYVLDNPVEFPGFYMKYSQPVYAPKSDLRFVFLVTVIGASVMQYLLRKSQHEQALAVLKKNPATKYTERVKAATEALKVKAKESKPAEPKPPASPTKDKEGGKDGKPPASPKKASKLEQQEALKKEAEAQVDAELAAELVAEIGVPSPYDCLAVDLFKLPLTVSTTVSWYLAGGANDPAYKTRKALKLTAADWESMPEEEQQEFLGMELWISDNLTAYEKDLAASGKKEKSGKEKRAARQKRNNPGAALMPE